jgi:PmbA protein
MLTEAQAKEFAQRVVRMCREAGADEASALVVQQTEKAAEVFDRRVRLSGESELTRTTVRLFRGRRGAVATGQGATEQAARQLVERALAFAGHTSADKFLGLADSAQLGLSPGDLRIYDPAVAELPLGRVEETALEAEAEAARREASVAGLVTSTFQTQAQRVTLCTSHGFCESYRHTTATLLLKAVAEKSSPGAGGRGVSLEDERLVGGAGSVTRSLADVNVEKVVARTLGRWAKQGETRPALAGVFPVVLAPSAARFVPAMYAQLCRGPMTMFLQGAFLGQVGERVCSPAVTFVDDPTRRGGIRSVPFDHEGVRPRSKVLIERGVLRELLLNTYYARALQREGVGNAVSSDDARFDVSHSNAYVEKGEASPEDLLAGVRQGFYVTRFLSGFISLANNFTQGAAGFWIENGKLSYPVRAATVSAPLREMLNGIEAVGNDLELTGAISSPSLLVGKMNVSPLA